MRIKMVAQARAAFEKIHVTNRRAVELDKGDQFVGDIVTAQGIKLRHHRSIANLVVEGSAFGGEFDLELLDRCARPQP